MMSICCSLSKLLPRAPEMPEEGGQGQFLADQWTLFQPRGQIMPTTFLLAPLDFQTFRHLYEDNIICEIISLLVVVTLALR